jgi:dynein heavy chain
MLVGNAGTGKSTCYKILAQAHTFMNTCKEKGFQQTSYKVLNPKSISMGEMYGEVDPYTQEWVDGLASSIIREVNTPRIDDP